MPKQEVCNDLMLDGYFLAMGELLDELPKRKIRTSKGRPSKYWKERGFDKNPFVTGYNHCLIHICRKIKEKQDIIKNKEV